MKSIKKIFSDLRNMKARENRFLVKSDSKDKNDKSNEKLKKGLERG
ncbi:MAG: hypothetical protein GX092_07365 [Clostridia bacterium]|nr:hypothetical protein [Clostridia bacterium]